MTYPPNGSNPDDEDLEAFLDDDISRWLDQLRRSDRSLYNLMALEVWSIAQTMDGLVPGFWNRFMENRQLALKQFVQYRHQLSEEMSDQETNSGAIDKIPDQEVHNQEMTDQE